MNESPTPAGVRKTAARFEPAHFSSNATLAPAVANCGDFCLTSGTSTLQPTGPAPTASNCSGYPPGGNCLAPYSYTFTIQVAYQGGWNLTYRGTTDVGIPQGED